MKISRNAPKFVVATCANAPAQIFIARADLLRAEMAKLAEIVVRDYSSLIDALVAQKNAIGISNLALEELCGLCAGHIDKLLGPSRSKKLSPWTFGLLCQALAIEFRPQINLEAAQKMAARWERRNSSQVRTPPARLSKEILARAAAELGRRGAIARNKQRLAQRHNGHANGHAAPNGR